MLSQRIFQQSRRHLTKPLAVLSRARFHSIYEDQASVLPNKIETASTNFKVKSFLISRKGV